MSTKVTQLHKQFINYVHNVFHRTRFKWRILRVAKCYVLQKNPISLTGNEVLKYPVGQTGNIPDYSDLFSNFSQSDEISHL